MPPPPPPKKKKKKKTAHPGDFSQNLIKIFHVDQREQQFDLFFTFGVIFFTDRYTDREINKQTGASQQTPPCRSAGHGV